MTLSEQLRRVAITGGNGCLGQRLAAELVRDTHVLLLDDYAGFHKGVVRQPDVEGDAKGLVEHVQCNLTEWDSDWVGKVRGADVVVHFAAVNPYPEATWEESRLSMRMSSNIVQAAQVGNVRRLVLATSNHVMGGYMHQGVDISTAPVIEPSAPVGRFTHFRLPGLDMDAASYATAKVALEEMGRAAAAASALVVVAVRIGWCQPGENVPSQMSATASPMLEDAASEPNADEEVAAGFDDRRLILTWLHKMWLSTRDFKQLFRKAVDSELPCKHLLLYGMSRNGGMRWSKKGWETLRYDPQDDSEAWLKEKRAAEEPDSKRRRLGGDAPEQ